MKLKTLYHVMREISEVKNKLISIGRTWYPEDYIEIRFDYESLDAPKGLHAYMNTLTNTTDFLIKFRLRRII